MTPNAQCVDTLSSFDLQSNKQKKTNHQGLSLLVGGEANESI